MISLVFTLIYGMATGGDLEDVRYRIISVTLLGLQGVLLHEFIVAKRFSFFTIAVFAASVIIELLSVTRSLLLGTVLLFLLAMGLSAPVDPACLARAARTPDRRRRAGRRGRRRGAKLSDRRRALDRSASSRPRKRSPARIRPPSPGSPRCAISMTR